MLMSMCLLIIIDTKLVMDDFVFIDTFHFDNPELQLGSSCRNENFYISKTLAKHVHI